MRHSVRIKLTVVMICETSLLIFYSLMSYSYGYCLSLIWLQANSENQMYWIDFILNQKYTKLIFQKYLLVIVLCKWHIQNSYILSTVFIGSRIKLKEIGYYEGTILASLFAVLHRIMQMWKNNNPFPILCRQNVFFLFLSHLFSE